MNMLIMIDFNYFLVNKIICIECAEYANINLKWQIYITYIHIQLIVVLQKIVILKKILLTIIIIRVHSFVQN